MKRTVFKAFLAAALFAACLLLPDSTIYAADLPDNVSQLADGKYQMKIYDIDDGYMQVPYLPELPHHDYEWELLQLEKKTGFLSYKDDKYSDVKIGIDVSKFQGKINWSEVSESGIDFVIVRLGYRGYSNGKLMLDDKFKTNMEGASKAGIKTGVYFFSQAINKEEAEEEADFVIEHIKDYKIDYPVTFDTEKIKFDEFRADGLTATELTDITKAFCDTIAEAGYQPMIYANSQWLTTKLELEELMEYAFWYADYEYIDHKKTPLYPYRFEMWQYSNQGKIEGIEGNVDLNLYFE